MLSLLPFTKTDFDRLISWVDNEELLVQFGGPAFSFPLTHEQLQNNLSDPKRHVYKVLLGDTVIGHAEIYLTEKNAKLCRLLIGDTTQRGKGLGLQLVNKLVNIAFTEMNCNTAELNVYDWNHAAIKCYQNAGFIFNPSKNSSITVKGKVWTSLNMLLVK